MSSAFFGGIGERERQTVCMPENKIFLLQSMRVKETSPSKSVKRVKEESDEDDEPLSARSVLPAVFKKTFFI